MRINHNIAALNTYRQLTVNNNSTQKAIEKLSSGLRINRAGDDAAGLAISEKMRAQIRGLNQASRNAQDGISLIQTAEGALNETHSILQRMRELAIQAANDTYTLSDRKEIQKEINQLIDEIDRIARDTEFNTKKILNGSFADDGVVLQIGANSNQNLVVDIKQMDSSKLGGDGGTTSQAVAEGGTISSFDFSSSSATISINGTDITLDANYNDIDGLVSALQTKFSAAGITGVTVEKNTAGDGIKLTSTSDITVGGSAGAIGLSAQTYTATTSTPTSPVLSSLKVDNIDSIADESAAAGKGVLTYTGADSAIGIIQKAIDQVSAERAKLGAFQNRLEHTINNLGTSAENLTAAESRIRDVDMASEMMEFTKMNILSQAAQAMLAQANQQPQAVLQLLR